MKDRTEWNRVYSRHWDKDPVSLSSISDLEKKVDDYDYDTVVTTTQ